MYWQKSPTKLHKGVGPIWWPWPVSMALSILVVVVLSGRWLYCVVSWLDTTVVPLVGAFHP